MMSNEVSLYQEVWKIAQSIDSRYRDTLSGRDALLVLMDMNGWFGLTPEFRNHDVYVSSVDHFRDRLELWLRAYKRTGAEKIDLMLEAYHEKLPDTCDRIAAFMMDENIKNQPAAGFPAFLCGAEHLRPYLSASAPDDLHTVHAVPSDCLPLVNYTLRRTGVQALARVSRI